MFVSLTSKEFREQVQSLKLDRKRRRRSARKVGRRGETSHATLKWKGGYGVGGQKGRREMEKNAVQPNSLQANTIFFLKKEKESRAHHKKSEQFLLGTTLAIASFPSEKAANKFFLLNKSCPVYIKT